MRARCFALSAFVGLRGPCANFCKLSDTAIALNREQSFDLIFVAMAADRHIAAPSGSALQFPHWPKTRMTERQVNSDTRP